MMRKYYERVRIAVESLEIRSFFQSAAGRKFLLFLEIALAIGFLLQPHLYYDPNAATFLKHFYADSISICGGLWIILVFLTMKPFRLPERLNQILTWILLFTFPIIAFFWLEQYNHLQFWSPIFGVEVKYQLLNLLIYYVIFYLILLLLNSIRNAAIVTMFLICFFGIMNYELTVFRSMSFIASDIFSVMTALSVANTYELQIDVQTAEFFFLALVIIALLLKLENKPFLKGKNRLFYLLICVGITVGFTNLYVYSDYLENIGVDFRVYRPQYKYRYYGTLLTTVRTFGYLHVKEPEGYSVKKVKQIAKKYGSLQEETEGKKPNVIVIMNESFADFSAISDLKVTEDYMPFFRSLEKNTIKGYTYSSIFGGNTANSEFEFLTGNTLAFLPDNSVPYQLFLRNKTAGLTYSLKAQGYQECLALHPYFKTGYSRYKIYPLMGFDAFFCSDDFELFTDTVNYHITDQENYKKIVELYKEHNRDDGPFYMFNVTMQNHGSYDGSTSETGDAVRIEGELSDQSWAVEYLNMIKMSDDSLKQLITYFSTVDEPTVVLFFGDHMPDLEEDFYDKLLGKSIDQLQGEELEQLYKIPFLIWANYDIEEEKIERSSNNYLSTFLYDVSGLERPPYIQFLTKLREKIPAINALGYWGDNGKFYEIEDESSPYFDLVNEYRLLQYNNLFGKDKTLTDFFFLDEKKEE